MNTYLMSLKKTVFSKRLRILIYIINISIALNMLVISPKINFFDLYIGFFEHPQMFIIIYCNLFIWFIMSSISDNQNEMYICIRCKSMNDWLKSKIYYMYSCSIIYILIMTSIFFIYSLILNFNDYGGYLINNGLFTTIGEYSELDIIVVYLFVFLKSISVLNLIGSLFLLFYIIFSKVNITVILTFTFNLLFLIIVRQDNIISNFYILSNINLELNIANNFISCSIIYLLLPILLNVISLFWVNKQDVFLWRIH